MSAEGTLRLPEDFEWPDPWEPVTDSGETLVDELRRELPAGHVLSGVPAVAVARRTDCDDVLFATSDPSKLLALVHLTWSGQVEPDPRWPRTTLYDGWQDWIERCLAHSGGSDQEQPSYPMVSRILTSSASSHSAWRAVVQWPPPKSRSGWSANV